MPALFTATRPMQGGNREGAASERGRASLHETGDAYACVFATSGRWRVIRCRDDVQYILQERARRAGSRPWRAVAFIYAPSALGAVLHRQSLGIPADDLARLMVALPRPATKSHASDGGRAKKRAAP